MTKIKWKKGVTENKLFTEHRKTILSFTIFLIGVLLIFSTYAWFSTSLNVKIKQFNMLVARNSGLTISLDGINFDHSVDLSRQIVINEVKRTYPTHINQWAANGLTPVSTTGIAKPGDYMFEIYTSSGVRYRSRDKENVFINVNKVVEKNPSSYSRYIAFDVFFKNVTGSPVPDNLYFEAGTEVTMTSDSTEEMQGLVNSIRVGIIKVGTLPNDANPSDIQNMKCQGECKAIIYEPNSQNHTALSIERAQKYNLLLKDGERFPTYSMIKAGGPLQVADNISGSPTLNLEYFTLQRTMYEEDFQNPLFTVPDGITKARIYVWIEGQDIDSLETDSQGAELFLNINFIKDTAGYEEE